MKDVVACLGLGPVEISPSMLASLCALFLFRFADSYIVEVLWIFKSSILIVYFFKCNFCNSYISYLFFSYCNQEPDKM